MIRRRLRFIVAVAAGAALAGFAGCAGRQRDELARLESEAASLREASAQRDAEIGALRAQLAAADSGFVGAPSGRDDFGAGVDVRRGASGELILEVAGDVLFDSGSHTLKASAKRTLEGIASRLVADYRSNLVRVEGYTDSDPIRKQAGKYADNEELSAQRALAVERYLVSRGVAHDRVYAAAFGATNPRGTKAASRRVEIVILGAER